MHDRASHPVVPPTRTVLVVIEELAIQELVSANLRHAGLFTVAASSSQDGKRLASEVRPDAVVIDLDSPGTADTSFALALRGTDAAPVPIVMMSADTDRCCGPHRELCGAACCLSKPFSPNELVRCVLRQFRVDPPPAKVRKERAHSPMRVGTLALGREPHTASLEREGRVMDVRLTPNEMEVLRCLMSNPERIHSRNEIAAAIWGRDSTFELRTIDQCIRRLRASLDLVDAGRAITTVRGFGYRFDERKLVADRAADWSRVQPELS